jgi:hypothetical protein
MEHSQKIRVPEFETNIGRQKYWIMAETEVTGPLEESIDCINYFGSNHHCVSYIWHPKEAEIKGFDMIQLDKDDEEMAVTCPTVLAKGRAIAVARAIEYAEEADLDLG